MRGMALGLGLSRHGGAPAYDPATIFSPLVAGAWWDASDLSTMRQTGTRAAPGAAAVVDSPVGLLMDKSGNNQDLLQATAAKRPILRQSGAVYYLEYDAVDDELGLVGAPVMGATCDAYFAYRAAATTSILLHDAAGGGGAYACFAANGDAASTAAAAGTPSLLIDGGAVADTRDVLFDAVNALDKVVEYQSLAVSTWAGFFVAGYNTAALGGRFYGAIMCPAQAADKRASIRNYLAGKQGRSL